MERTFVFLKPEAFTDGVWLSILQRLREVNLPIVAAGFLKPTEELMARHYEEHKGQDHYDPIMKQSVGKTILALRIEAPSAVLRVSYEVGHWKESEWKHNPTAIRPTFMKPGRPGWRNFIHRSDSIEAAVREDEMWDPYMSPFELPIAA